MRVITGRARGRKLVTPAGLDVRPTSAKVKESIFSIIQFEVEGARVLDLFAGTGQMGIEALSRGARACVFVEKARESLSTLRKNLDCTGPWPGAKVLATDALSFLRGCGEAPFDIAFLDPPYAAGLLEECLPLLAGRMHPGGVILCEADRKTELPEQFSPFFLKKRYQYGKTHLLLYRAQP